MNENMAHETLECCKELSRVWNALGVSKYNGKSASENVFEFMKNYTELIYAVARVFPGESRHETALRYIREAEKSADGAGQDKASQ